MKTGPVLDTFPLQLHFPTLDPFLFCAHHLDRYPKGNGLYGPAASLEGRHMGMDFEGLDGWRMYHGAEVPGFPQHPHRGFETITVTRQGLVDHADSMGAGGRYGEGDVQWMTAGSGIVHAEMFPLLRTDRGNSAELFQIWLNLPAKDKMVDPHFAMFWNKEVPILGLKDKEGRAVEVRVVAGSLEGLKVPKPPPHSWAAKPDSDIAIWTIKLAPGASWTLPPGPIGTKRRIYFFRGDKLKVSGTAIPAYHGADVVTDEGLLLENGGGEAEILLLQGRPIGETVVQYGPFVMNSRREIQQAFDDYERTGFGGWPWEKSDPIHGPEPGHFAKHADGKVERPQS